MKHEKLNFLDRLYLARYHEQQRSTGIMKVSAFYELLISCMAVVIGAINLVAIIMVQFGFATKIELNSILSTPFFVIMVLAGAFVLMRVFFGNASHRRNLESIKYEAEVILGKACLATTKWGSLILGFGIMFVYLSL